jgi:hypothetical protein
LHHLLGRAAPYIRQPAPVVLRLLHCSEQFTLLMLGLYSPLDPPSQRNMAE